MKVPSEEICVLPTYDAQWTCDFLLMFNSSHNCILFYKSLLDVFVFLHDFIIIFHIFDVTE